MGDMVISILIKKIQTLSKEQCGITRLTYSCRLPAAIGQSLLFPLSHVVPSEAAWTLKWPAF